MSTQKIWDLHMTYDSPITEEFLAGTTQLAESIAKEPSVIWKIWTYEEGTNHYGSTHFIPLHPRQTQPISFFNSGKTGFHPQTSIGNSRRAAARFFVFGANLVRPDCKSGNR